MVFDGEFYVERAILIPAELLAQLCKSDKTPNTFVLSLTRKLSVTPGVQDITEKFQFFPKCTIDTARF